MRKLIVISAVWCPSCLLLNKEIKNNKNDFIDIEIEKLDYDLYEDTIKYKKENLESIISKHITCLNIRRKK